MQYILSIVLILNAFIFKLNPREIKTSYLHWGCPGTASIRCFFRSRGLLKELLDPLHCTTGFDSLFPLIPNVSAVRGPFILSRPIESQSGAWGRRGEHRLPGNPLLHLDEKSTISDWRQSKCNRECFTSLEISFKVKVKHNLVKASCFINNCYFATLTRQASSFMLIIQ